MSRAEAQDNANNAAADIDLILIKYNVSIYAPDNSGVIYINDHYREDNKPKVAFAKITNLPI